MSLTKEKVTAPYVSATTDTEQSPSQNLIHIIPEELPKINENLAQLDQHELLRQMSAPDYLHTVSLTELYETAYTPRVNVVDDFLNAGTYLFVGGPKVGKSFFMAQLGYHVSTGLPLWERTTHPCTVLYLALEDTHVRLQNDCP